MCVCVCVCVCLHLKLSPHVKMCSWRLPKLGLNSVLCLTVKIAVRNISIIFQWYVAITECYASSSGFGMDSTFTLGYINVPLQNDYQSDTPTSSQEHFFFNIFQVFWSSAAPFDKYVTKTATTTTKNYLRTWHSEQHKGCNYLSQV